MKFPSRHKKIYIYPNRYGFLFFALFALSIAIGATYNNNLVFLAGFGLISALFVAILVTAKNLRGLEILSVHVSSGFPNEKVPVAVLIKNSSHLPHTRLGISIDGQSTKGELEYIGPNDTATVRLTYTLPGKRGVHIISRVSFSTQNPFGLFYSWYWFHLSAKYFVFPKPLGQKERPKRYETLGEEFSGLKEFEAGDRLSRVSWKHFAKRGDLLIKEFNESENQQDLIDIAEATQNDFEQKLSQLSLWLVEAEGSQRHYALRLSDHLSSMGSGKDHLKSCLETLAEVKSV